MAALVKKVEIILGQETCSFTASIDLITFFPLIFRLERVQKIRQKRSSMNLLERESRDCFKSQLLQKF